MSYRYRPDSRDTILSELRTLLQADLTADRYRLASQMLAAYDDAVNGHWQHQYEDLVEGIAEHCGPLGPAIRALASHVEPDGVGETCRDGCRHRWPATGREWGGEASR